MSKVPLIGVVNDDTVFLELIQELLEEEGFKTFICKEGNNAYGVIKKHRPDLVVLDIRMEHPETGWQILEMLRLDPELAALPVIVCTADAPFLRAKELRLREMHCLGLEKPFNLSELLAKIAEMLSS